jgi:hypothetical protein
LARASLQANGVTTGGQKALLASAKANGVEVSLELNPCASSTRPKPSPSAPRTPCVADSVLAICFPHVPSNGTTRPASKSLLGPVVEGIKESDEWHVVAIAGAEETEAWEFKATLRGEWAQLVVRVQQVVGAPKGAHVNDDSVLSAVTSSIVVSARYLRKANEGAKHCKHDMADLLMQFRLHLRVCHEIAIAATEAGHSPFCFFDVSAAMMHPFDVFDTLTSPVLPPVSQLWSVHAIHDSDVGKLWFHSHGIRRFSGNVWSWCFHLLPLLLNSLLFVGKFPTV